MKATLEFDLDRPGDNEAHRRCVKATDMASVLFELSHNSRRKIINKIDSQYPNATEEEANTISNTLDFVYEEFNSLMNNQNINIEELIS